jgi:hypothetical protein
MTPRRRTTTQHIGTLALALFLAAAWGVAPAATTEAAAPPHAQQPARTASLDLRLGDLTRFFDPREFATPPEELEEIIVQGRRPEPLPEHRVIPQGLAAVFYGLAHPTQAWRILLPDPNLQIADRSADDLREPPGLFRARILAPGRIYD